MKRNLFAIAWMLGFFVAGVGLLWTPGLSPDEGGVARGELRVPRDPANIRKVYDFSDLEGAALSTASKQRMVAGFSAVRQGEMVGITVGNFVYRSESGEKEFACRKFSQVIVEFIGEGLAVAGEKPIMEVEGACVVADDLNFIAPLWVPMARIVSETPGDGEFDFWDTNSVRIRFSNIPDQWPLLWVVTRIKLTNDNNEEIAVDSSDLQALVERPLVLDLSR